MAKAKKNPEMSYSILKKTKDVATLLKNGDISVVRSYTCTFSDEENHLNVNVTYFIVKVNDSDLTPGTPLQFGQKSKFQFDDLDWTSPKMPAMRPETMHYDKRDFINKVSRFMQRSTDFKQRVLNNLFDGNILKMPKIVNITKPRIVNITLIDNVDDDKFLAETPEYISRYRFLVTLYTQEHIAGILAISPVSLSREQLVPFFQNDNIQTDCQSINNVYYYTGDFSWENVTEIDSDFKSETEHLISRNIWKAMKAETT
jgi:hypothetical protein